MKYLAIALTLVALLAGCADQPPKDAVIEDRGIQATGGTGQADTGVATQGTDMTSTEGRPIGTEGTGGIQGDGAGQTSEKVETHGLADAVADVKPLDGSQGGTDAGGGAAGTGGTGSEVATAGDAAAIALIVKDPNSPLSKRVILFDFDSSAIRDEYRSLLEAHAEFLKSNPVAKVILQGHADERGSREYNLALGQRRAESVYKALSLLGVPEAQMEPVSLGEEKPVAEGHDEEAWQQNRRTEILYQGE